MEKEKSSIRRLVVNTNVLFSIFKEKSFTRALIFKYLKDKKVELFSPELCLKELFEHEKEICEKAGISEEIFIKILNRVILKNLVKFVPENEYMEFLEKAKNISPDPKDIDVFALALKLNCPIWSNDKRLKKQNVIKVYSTEELIKEFGLKI